MAALELRVDGKRARSDGSDDGGGGKRQLVEAGTVHVRDPAHDGMLMWLSEDSAVLWVPGALCLSPVDAMNLYSHMDSDDVCPPTPNPMNSNSVLRRKQKTFGTKAYDFGQKCPHESEREKWPDAVEQALTVSEQVISVLEGSGLPPVLALVPPHGEKPVSTVLNTVHTNLYRDGNVALKMHSDDEKQMVKGAPICSFTVLMAERMAAGSARDDVPRPFCVFKKPLVVDRKLRAADQPPDNVESAEYAFYLCDGDLLVMLGSMQDEFWHSVPPVVATRKKAEKSPQPRINMTVRAFA